MTQTAFPARLFVTLFFFWLLLGGSLAMGNLAAGLVVAGAIAWLFRGSLSHL